jgi:hypothetical protein
LDPNLLWSCSWRVSDRSLSNHVLFWWSAICWIQFWWEHESRRTYSLYPQCYPDCSIIWRNARLR